MNTISFFKFREIVNLNDLSKDHSLDALLNSYAIFSSRKNFTDHNDSKIILDDPTPEAIMRLSQQPKINEEKKKNMQLWVSGKRFTQHGISFLNMLRKNLDEVIDSYPIYCVSSHCKKFLWENYAGAHKGFCIEFNFHKSEQPAKVTYQKNVASLNVLDILKEVILFLVEI